MKIIREKSTWTSTLDPERQKLAKEYARIRRKYMLLDLLLGAILLLAWLLFGWSAHPARLDLQLDPDSLDCCAGFWWDIRRRIYDPGSSLIVLHRVYPAPPLSTIQSGSKRLDC